MRVARHWWKGLRCCAIQVPKETGEAHAGLGAFGTAGAAADLAGDDERANTALRQIVVRGNAREWPQKQRVRVKSVRRAHIRCVEGRWCDARRVGRAARDAARRHVGAPREHGCCLCGGESAGSGSCCAQATACLIERFDIRCSPASSSSSS